MEGRAETKYLNERPHGSCLHPPLTAFNHTMANNPSA